MQELLLLTYMETIFLASVLHHFKKKSIAEREYTA